MNDSKRRKIQKGEKKEKKEKKLVKWRCSTGLHHCLWNSVAVGCMECLQSALDAGANINYSKSGGWTLLHEACHLSHVKVVEFLLGRKADINRKDNLGVTPLHAACMNGQARNDKKLVKMLLQRGVEVNVEDHFKRTPIFIACVRNYAGVVSLLLDEGAKIDVEEYLSKPPHYQSGGSVKRTLRLYKRKR